MSDKDQVSDTDDEQEIEETVEISKYGTDEALAEEFPEHLRTRFTEIDLICPRCRSGWYAVVAEFINVKTHPAAREGILRGTMHRSRCAACRRFTYEKIDQIWQYYDPDEQLIVQVRIDREYKAGGGEDLYYKRLEEMVMRYAEEDVRVDVAFGMQDLIDKHLGGQAAVDAAMRRRAKERELRLHSGMIRLDNEHEYFGEEETQTE